MENIAKIILTIIICLALLGTAHFFDMLTWISVAVVIFSALGTIGSILFDSDETSESPTSTDSQPA